MASTIGGFEAFSRPSAWEQFGGASEMAHGPLQPRSTVREGLPGRRGHYVDHAIGAVDCGDVRSDATLPSRCLGGSGTLAVPTTRASAKSRFVANITCREQPLDQPPSESRSSEGRDPSPVY